MMLRTMLGLLTSLSLIARLAQTASAYDAIPSQSAVVIAPKRCSDKIGSGGNLKSSSTELEGKCEGSGLPPELRGDGEGAPMLHFAVSSKGSSSKDRTELAFTKSRLKFGEDFYAGFDVRIPRSSSRTKTWYYLVQFWQGGNRAPIAGLRMDRNASHTATVMARGEGNAKGTTVSKVFLPPDQWVRMALRLNVVPSGVSCVSVWQLKEGPQQWCGQIGYLGDGTLKNWYRMKFGIYKGSEPGNFQVEFRDIRIGRLLHDVWP